MNNNWNYHNPAKIIFGTHRLKELATLADHAENILLITTRGSTKRGLTDTIRNLLSSKKITVLDNVQPNPDIDYIEADYRHLSAGGKHDTIIAIGGGSAIDTAKAFSYLLGASANNNGNNSNGNNSNGNKGTTNGNATNATNATNGNKGTNNEITDGSINLRRQLEEGKSLSGVKTLPIIAIPTTAGTGSEVTPFATVWDKQNHKKYSLAAPQLCPEIALLDPSLTLSLPGEITTYTALDALSHAFESLWNRNHNPISGAYATRSIVAILKHLPALINEPDNINYRAQIMEASLLSGLAISSTRTALAHSISYPLTAHLDMPHGLACSFTLPALLEFNGRDAAHQEHFQNLINALGYKSLDALKHALIQLFDTLKVKSMLNKYINSTNDLLALTPEMLTPGRADNNLRPATEEDLRKIILL